MLKRIETDFRARADEAGIDPVGGESASEGLPKRVLVAEDNIVSQQVARHNLEAIGCNVMVVEHGAAAVAACARQDFGLVLMDLQMPRMDGLQATREIRRQERPGRHVPIIALTTNAASDELARCTAAGMNGLLTKPLDLARLRQMLDRFGLARRTAELQAGEPDLMTLQCLDELDSAVTAGERTRVQLLAHKIKGGASLYAHRLSALAANIESEAMSTALPELAAAVEKLRLAFDEATLHSGAKLP